MPRVKRWVCGFELDLRLGLFSFPCSFHVPEYRPSFISSWVKLSTFSFAPLVSSLKPFHLFFILLLHSCNCSCPYYNSWWTLCF